jgi:gamma-glutamylputrescine oxidase
MALGSSGSETWYEATVERGEALPALTGTVEADVCVVGAGLAGLTTALELQRRGRQTVLLEAGRLAAGASGRNGGFVFNGFARAIDELAAVIGRSDAKALYRLSQRGSEYVRAELASLAPDAKMGDGVLVALRIDDAEALKRRRDLMAREFDEVLELKSTEETRVLLRTERYYQSVLQPKAFHIHPLRYALALAKDAQGQGVRIHENTRALLVERHGAGFVVRTPSGTILSEHVIHCVSALDRRILWGGKITTRVNAPRLLAQAMKSDMVSVFPQLGDPPIDYAWAGIMGYALHKMPLIGRSADGQFYASAFGGHGLNTTAMAGLLVAGAIAEGDDEYRRFAAFEPRWAGGPFGRAGVQGTYWLMQLRDFIDEARSRRRGGHA